MTASYTPILQRYEAEVWHQDNDVAAAAIDELIAPNFETNVPDTLPDLKGKAGFKRLISLLRTAFPAGRYCVKVVQEKGDKVAVAWTLDGLHTGDLMGLPPSGRHLTLMGTAIYRIENGQIAEMWDDLDFYRVIQQLKHVAECSEMYLSAQMDRDG